MFTAVQVFVDHGDVYVPPVLFDLFVAYGAGICVPVCGVVCIVICDLFLESRCCLFFGMSVSGWCFIGY